MSDTPLPGEPWAWCVVTAEGWRALFKDRASAERYAANNHGVLVPLYPAPA